MALDGDNSIYLAPQVNDGGIVDPALPAVIPLQGNDGVCGQGLRVSQMRLPWRGKVALCPMLGYAASIQSRYDID
jgi:hypothetical protein